MSPRRISLILSFFVLFLPFVALANDSDIFISEFSIGSENVDDDFIELYNQSSIDISLKEWRLCRRTKTNTSTCESRSSSLIKTFSTNEKIPAHGFYLWTNGNGEKYTAIPADTHTDQALTTNNSLAVYNSDGVLVDAVTWGSGHALPFAPTPILSNPVAKKSHTRNFNTLAWEENQSPTPTNSHGQMLASSPPTIPDPKPIPPSPTKTNTLIRINELLPNPFNEDDEWIEFYNFGPDNIALDNFTISDATNKPYIFPAKTTLEAKHFLLLLRKDSDIALNNTNEIVTLADASKNIVSQVSYGKTIEGASLNYAPSGYRWSRTITPGAENILGNAPETKGKDIPDTAYRGVLTVFSADGKDGDGDHIKYTWDFGDGHKSYKGETTHRYEEEGKYEGTLTVSDGTESTVTAFTIDVEKYDAPKIRMTELIPNPDGKDTDAEFITLENRSKKSVDLLGWSIATGWKKLVNHPIRESFVIPKKSSRNITHASSAFTLPNEKGRIELRSPDGKTVQKLKYNLKGKSAEEDARLVKEKGKKWEWIARQGTGNEEQGTIQTADEPPADGLSAVAGASAVIDEQEKQLKQDTERITLRKNRGEELLSTEQNPTEEMRRLISYGTDIETPIAVLALVPRVAGVTDEASQAEEEQNNIDEHFNMNALINHWLAEE